MTVTPQIPGSRRARDRLGLLYLGPPGTSEACPKARRNSPPPTAPLEAWIQKEGHSEYRADEYRPVVRGKQGRRWREPGRRPRRAGPAGAERRGQDLHAAHPRDRAATIVRRDPVA